MERINYPSEGWYYEGEVKDGKPEGQGIFYYVDGKPYKGGEFVGGILQGKGWFYESNGVKYKGEFKNDLPDGEGEVYYPNGQLSYKGTFAKGSFSGQGVIYFINGNKLYEGMFADGKYSGRGVMYREDGSKMYEGDFLDEKYNGEGRLYGANGILFQEGIFERGHLVEGKTYSDKGNLFCEGEYGIHSNGVDSIKKGRVYYTSNYIVYDGVFPNTGEKILDGFTGYKEFYCEYERTPENELVMTNCRDVYEGKPLRGTYIENGVDTGIVVQFYEVRGENGRYNKKYAYNQDNPDAFFEVFHIMTGELKSTFEKGHLVQYYCYPDKKPYSGRIKYIGDGILVNRVAKPQGQGKMFDKEGHLTYEGKFSQGETSGRGKKYDSDGHLLYEGEFSEGKIKGQGKQYDKDGHLIYEGEFVDGKFEGQGKEYDANGHLVYEGGFWNGKNEGYGKRFDNDGKIIHEGEFINGMPAEEFKNSPEYADYMKKKEKKTADRIADQERKEAAKKEAKKVDIIVFSIAAVIIIVLIWLALKILAWLFSF